MLEFLKKVIHCVSGRSSLKFLAGNHALSKPTNQADFEWFPVTWRLVLILKSRKSLTNNLVLVLLHNLSSFPDIIELPIYSILSLQSIGFQISFLRCVYLYLIVSLLIESLEIHIKLLRQRHIEKTLLLSFSYL